jgi:HEAT repeat protein
MLGHDASDAFRRGLKFLTKTTDCVFDHETNGLARAAKSDTALESDLQYGTDSTRLAALWGILDRGPAASQVADAVRKCLRSKNSILQTESARALGAMGSAASSAAPDLIHAFASRNSDVRRESALAIEQLQLPHDMKGPHGDTVYEELVLLLEDPEPPVVQAAARALSQYGQHAQRAGVHMIRHLCRALVACHYDVSDFYFEVLETITPDVEQFLQEHMAETHPDLYPVALETLEQSRLHRSQQQAAS